MCKINQHYIDSFAKPAGYLNSNLSSAKHAFAAFRFQPANVFDIGLYGTYQSAIANGNPTIIQQDEFGNVTTHYGTNILRVSAIGVGITSNIFISHFLKFRQKESDFLKRCRIAVEINGGIGFSRATLDILYPTYIQASQFYDYSSSNDFQGQFSLKFEYDYLKNAIVSSVGVKCGFQYLHTKTITNHQGIDWISHGKPINLDFGGFLGSVYLVFGK